MLYGIDASSAQGSVTWSEVAKSCAFGFEKVTQGTGYASPFWTASKSHLQQLKAQGDFVPGAYMFLEAGNAGAQADFFANQAGNLDGWLIALDAEPTGVSSPRLPDIVEAVARLRIHYPNAKIGGYFPEWYWGGNVPFTMIDWLWASRYVSGSGSPNSLYGAVPVTWWDGYGGRTIELLQFTESAVVGGVAGQVDASAFRGDLAQLKALTTKTAPPITPPPVTTTGDDMLYVFDQLQGKQIALPVPVGATKIMLFAAPERGTPEAALPRIDVISGPSSDHHTATPTWEHQEEFTLVPGTQYIALNRLDSGNTPVTVQFS